MQKRPFTSPSAGYQQDPALAHEVPNGREPGMQPRNFMDHTACVTSMPITLDSCRSGSEIHDSKFSRRLHCVALGACLSSLTVRSQARPMVRSSARRVNTSRPAWRPSWPTPTRQPLTPQPYAWGMCLSIRYVTISERGKRDNTDATVYCDSIRSCHKS